MLLGGTGVLAMVLGVAMIAVSPALRGTPAGDPSDSALAQARLERIVEPVEARTEPTRAAPVQEELVAATRDDEPPVPADSGSGRRIVFDQSDQRVWLVSADEVVERTYLVSGSKHDNLEPGRYRVQARYRQATAYDYSGTMEYFVQFTTGRSEPIGFHTVPRDNAGLLEQTKEQLGTPMSAGCVRQWIDDAKALWEFAPVGTPVVVTA